MLILKGFAVDEEAAVVVEMEGVGVPAWGGMGSGCLGPPWVVGPRGRCDRLRELGFGSGMG